MWIRVLARPMPAVAALSLLCSLAAPRCGRAELTVVASVISCAGTSMASAPGGGCVKMVSVLGQPGPAAVSRSDRFVNFAGFLRAWLAKRTGGGTLIRFR